MSKCILYLDYDGVLHPEPVYRHPKRGMYFGVEHEGHTLFEHANALIETLTPYPDISIVLSTSWVRVLGFSRARNYLPPLLRQRVIGATFHSQMNQLEFDAMTRGSQVLADATRRNVRGWVAVDDDTEGWLSAVDSHLVQTDGHTGISAPSAMEALIRKLRAQLEQ